MVAQGKYFYWAGWRQPQILRVAVGRTQLEGFRRQRRQDLQEISTVTRASRPCAVPEELGNCRLQLRPAPSTGGTPVSRLCRASFCCAPRRFCLPPAPTRWAV